MTMTWSIVIPRVMEICDDNSWSILMTRAWCIVMRRAGNILMTESCSNLMKSVMEYFDEWGYRTL